MKLLRKSCSTVPALRRATISLLTRTPEMGSTSSTPKAAIAPARHSVRMSQSRTTGFLAPRSCREAFPRACGERHVRCRRSRRARRPPPVQDRAHAPWPRRRPRAPRSPPAGCPSRKPRNASRALCARWPLLVALGLREERRPSAPRRPLHAGRGRRRRCVATPGPSSAAWLEPGGRDARAAARRASRRTPAARADVRDRGRAEHLHRSPELDDLPHEALDDTCALCTRADEARPC